MEKRNVPAQDATTKPKMWDLTKSQWLVYYWFISHSKWNSFENEQHYYIYKKDFTLTQISRDTGIKSTKTISEAIKKLMEPNIMALAEAGSYSNAYYIFTTHLYTSMSVGIIQFLLAFYDNIDTSMAITLFAILSRWYKLEKNRVSFTISELIALLGLAKQTAQRKDIVICLALLSFCGLIKLDVHEYTNRLGVVCKKYTLTNIDNEGKNIKDYLNEDEVPREAIKELWNIISQMPL